jgi:ribosomal protein S18 acetylase RimI-like enzyme
MENMQFIILDDRQKAEYSNQILEMVKEGDKDFVPPLSARSSTTQTNLTGGESSFNGVISYFDEMMKQKIICAVEDDKVLGFVSFKENYVTDAFDKTPNIYLSTLILRPEARGKNLTFNMYDYLFNAVYPKSSIYTRTWSTNAPHVKILSKFNFDEILRKKNDRGEGIDTVYYALIR